MFEYFQAEKEKKKNMTTAEKKEAKRKKDELEEKYTTCTLDGRKEKVGNFRVEPPGLFRGRGEHPKKGSLKVYLNCNASCTSISTLCYVAPCPSRRYHDQHREKRTCPYAKCPR